MLKLLRFAFSTDTFLLLAATAVGMIPTLTFGQVLDIDRALVNEEYLNSIKPIFQNASELQMGGTHTRGNRTVLKNGTQASQLDPKIIIINPDESEHSSEESVLSIVGRGNDLELLHKIEKISSQFGHRFAKIYLSNVFPTLPLPQPMPPEVSSVPYPFDYNGATEFKLIGGIIQAYLTGLKQPGRQKYDLYRLYKELLTSNGQLNLKTFARKDINEMFMMSMLSQENQNFEDPEFIFVNRLALRVQANLKSRNSVYYLSKKELEKFCQTPQEKSIFYSIQNQFKMLDQGGFQLIKMGFAQLSSWGWNCCALNENCPHDSLSMTIYSQVKPD